MNKLAHNARPRIVKAGLFLFAISTGLTAWAAQPGAATAIGEAAKVVAEVRGMMGPITRELVVQDEVHSQEVIETGPDSATRIVFVDGTELSMGPESKVTLDKYVYDPEAGTGALVMNFVDGIFEFASGLIPSENYDLRTPFANLAIRGSRLVIMVDPVQGAEVINADPESEVYAIKGGVPFLLEFLKCTSIGTDSVDDSGECDDLEEKTVELAALLDIDINSIIPAAAPPPFDINEFNDNLDREDRVPPSPQREYQQE